MEMRKREGRKNIHPTGQKFKKRKRKQRKKKQEKNLKKSDNERESGKPAQLHSNPIQQFFNFVKE